MERTIHKEAIKQHTNTNSPSDVPVKENKQEQKKSAPISGIEKELDNAVSGWNAVLKFVAHPFVVAGGILVALYFLIQGRRQLVTENDKLRKENKELHEELRVLKKKNKKLKVKAEEITDMQEQNPKRQLFGKSLPSTPTVYLD